MTYKHTILTLFLFGLYGCGGGSNDDETILDTIENIITEDKQDSDSATVLISDVVVLNEDQYYGVSFNINKTAQVQTKITIIDGVSIEAFLVTEKEYNTWVTVTQNGQFTTATLNYFEELSISPVATTHESEWTALGSGNYYYILENTDYGTTTPPINFKDDKVTAEFSISAK
ncbi:hypothetical protein [Photobacterium leiognathi]|uniref:hypothetical protein n=1 Tax=Photobacterium leiognathi TaxID=553611 RepID=UPI002981950E|nr:hypothetical protein [Photobacterium leiognathi]